ncbi:MAG: hypothetical protein KAG14_04870, partial [Mycoplasmataceae bacterium]|nr:hypothetical protein [Mycoplasmataceae bacterium]
MFKFLLKLFKTNKEINTNGCYDEVDERNFGSEIIAGHVTREDLTNKDFSTYTFKDLIYQAWTDFCVGCSGCYSKQAHEQRGMMSWVGAYALCCRLLGYVPQYGMSILVMMKTRVKYGIPEEKYYPFNSNKTKAQLANWRNMPASAIANALTHRDKSYFVVTIQPEWSKFDTFRAYLNKMKDDKVTINTGADGHAITLCEQKTINGELRIGGPDSYGMKKMNYRLGISINGFRYFNAYEIAQFFSGYIGSDMERTKAELLNEYNGKAVKVENDNKCYLVTGGQRRYLRNEPIAWAHGTLLYNDQYVHLVSEDELDMIPVGDPMKYKEGKFYPIVQRMLE